MGMAYVKRLHSQNSFDAESLSGSQIEDLQNLELHTAIHGCEGCPCLQMPTCHDYTSIVADCASNRGVFAQ